MKMIERIRELRRGWVLVAGLSIVLVFAAQLHGVIEKVDKALFEAQWAEKLVMIGLVCDDVDYYVNADNDWGVYDYANDLKRQIEVLDATPKLSAGLFNADLVALSEVNLGEGDVRLSPLTDERLRALVTQYRDRGETRAQYYGDNGAGEWIRVYYRWIPTGQQYSDRLLMLCAMRETPLDGEPNAILTQWCTALLAVTGVLNIVVGVGEVIGHGKQRLSSAGDSGVDGGGGRAGQST